MFYKFNVLIILCLTTCSIAFSQSGNTVRGVIIDSTSKVAIPGVKAQLLKQSDDSFVSGAISDRSGIFLLKNVPSGQYTLLNSLIVSNRGVPDFAIKFHNKFGIAR